MFPRTQEEEVDVPLRMAMPGTMTAGPKTRDICTTPAVQNRKAAQLQAASRRGRLHDLSKDLTQQTHKMTGQAREGCIPWEETREDNS
ncbi:hypothetical protein M0657_008085 [Pyricularia oryzae]|uniref:Uncharacterized protein n=2 Tax=Pyricularia oryzae TaxID=318829 RepID=A0AA97PIN7_PYRO3|nr:hypothetical protein OOU_Y34scaffold00672g5 [Pyricularia oryzae Y34]KAI7910808.1 hypothetical protein M9X92_010875 [Pyricularia oryzae]KAI7917495.1 hypothetical protein M0657_008085 [Pyricularia oryzae]